MTYSVDSQAGPVDKSSRQGQAAGRPDVHETVHVGCFCRRSTVRLTDCKQIGLCLFGSTGAVDR